MSKLRRSLALRTLGVAFATLSIASAQVYTTIDFPGATFTFLNGGPNPEGTSVGGYTDSSGVRHGFQLKKGVFRSFDPPGSTSTTPAWMPTRVAPTTVSFWMEGNSQRWTSQARQEPASAVSTPQVKCLESPVLRLPARLLPTALWCPRKEFSRASILPARSAAGPPQLTRPVQSSVLTRIVREWATGTCGPTELSPRSIFRALFLRSLERVTRSATA